MSEQTAQVPAGHPWEEHADALLYRAAVVARLAFDRLPSPMAGLRIDDRDLRRALAELPGQDAGDDADLREVVSRMEPLVEATRASMHADPSLKLVAASAGLSHLEVEALALIAAADADPRRQRLIAYLNDDVTQRYLTPFSLAQVLLDNAAAHIVRPGAPLERARLMQLSNDDQPWSRRQLRPAPLVCWRLMGIDDDDPSLPASFHRETFEDADVSDVGAARGGMTSDSASDLLVVSGPDHVRRRQAVAGVFGVTELLVSDVPASQVEWDALVRQSTLDDVPVVIEISADLTPGDCRNLERASHLRWALSSAVNVDVRTLPRRPWRAVKPKTSFATVHEISRALGPEAVELVDGLTAAQLEATARVAHAVEGDVQEAVRRLAAGRIDRLATRTVPRRSWDDLVLREGRTERVREVVVRYQRRRRVFDEWGFTSTAAPGVLALFSGESGTGKTLAAEIVANELGQDLYTIDLSQVTSKYIGETEKNLESIFEAAESSPVVLFFDEADSMLGKRSEVTSANDRYANLEVAYLLQRVERYPGVVVMATNLAGNIDRAFLRRIHVAVDFPMPDVEQRLRIWERSLPPGMPVAGVDLREVATQFDMSGGFIRNASLTAAFLAADSGGPLTPALLAEAVRRELQKAGRYVRDQQASPPIPSYGAARPERAIAP